MAEPTGVKRRRNTTHAGDLMVIKRRKEKVQKAVQKRRPPKER